MTPAQKLKAMVEAATPGPWRYEVGEEDPLVDATIEDARLIVALVNCAPQIAEWFEARVQFRDLPQDVGYADYREASRRLTYVTDALLSALSEQLEKP